MSASPADAAAPTAPRPSGSEDLRRALLAVAVLDDIDVVHDDDTLTVPVPGIARRGACVSLPAPVAADVLAGWPPASEQARLRLRSWLRAHRALAAAPHPAALLRERARALAVAHDSAWHPGEALSPAWSRTKVPGGALVLGLGVVGLDAGGSAVPLWPDLPAAAGMDEAATGELWACADDHAQRMGTLAAARVARSSPSSAPARPPRPVRSAGSERAARWSRARHPSEAGATVLRPYGGCDVPTLLSTRSLRGQLAGSDEVGMRAVSVPDRTRGWFDARHVDRAFVAAAWTAVEPAERGLPAPLLVTCDEVSRPG